MCYSFSETILESAVCVLPIDHLIKEQSILKQVKIKKVICFCSTKWSVWLLGRITDTHLPEYDGIPRYYVVREANFSPGTFQHLPSLLASDPPEVSGSCKLSLTACEMEDLTPWMAGSSRHLLPQQHYSTVLQMEIYLSHSSPSSHHHPSTSNYNYFFSLNKSPQAQLWCLFNFPDDFLTNLLLAGRKASCRLVAPSREYRCLAAAGGRKSEPKSLSPSPPPLSILCVNSLTAFPSYLLQQCQAKWKG